MNDSIKPWRQQSAEFKYTKQLNWELIGLLADKLSGKEARLLKQAYEAVNEDENITCITLKAGQGSCGLRAWVSRRYYHHQRK